MKKTIMIFLGIFSFLFSKSQKSVYDTYPVYEGNDLGLTYSVNGSTFKIWSPTAEEARLIFYKDGAGGEAISTVIMSKNENGCWSSLVKGDQKGKFYVFKVKINGKWLNEVPDPYAKSVGVNGKRAMVIDLKDTDPGNWNHDKSPTLRQATDAIIYELHVRDASIAKNSGIKNKGKFIGLTETGTKNEKGQATGLDHIKELGVTHIHLLPSYDFLSLDESIQNNPKYNWGYDPLNYNVPEGSYSTDPFDGKTRITEFKKMVQSFHQNGIGVIMDVVYNHTGKTEDSYFNELVPGYYYRQTKDGKFSNATACGNETASERPMMRKFMLESVLYWAKEYHIDGFRFDLMGVHDLETMNLISKELHALNPEILIYGEGWTAGESPLPDSLRALKKYAYKLNDIAVFSDDIRDGIKGSVFEHEDKGFVSGKPGMEQSIKFGIVAAGKHPQIDYSKVNYSKAPYAAKPSNTITYTECHDNHVLWDKLAISAKEVSEDIRKEMDKLAMSIVLTSQGIPFIHAGTEFLRTKNGVENSFESPNSINQIDWNLKTKNKEIFDYVKALIRLRKEHPAFRMNDSAMVAKNINFIDRNQPGTIVYVLNGEATNDPWKKILIIFNSNAKRSISLPKGDWKIFIRDNVVEKRNAEGPNFMFEPYSCSILYQE